MICYDDIWVWLLACHVSMTAQRMVSSTSHVSVSESSDSEQSSESSDLPSIASSSMSSASYHLTHTAILDEAHQIHNCGLRLRGMTL